MRIVEGEVLGNVIYVEEHSGVYHEPRTCIDEVESPPGLASSSQIGEVDGKSTHRLGITVEPSHAQHGDECGEDGGGQSYGKDFDTGSHGMGAIALRKRVTGTESGLVVGASRSLKTLFGFPSQNRNHRNGWGHEERTSLSPPPRKKGKHHDQGGTGIHSRGPTCDSRRPF